jgi:hypothetical protein
MMSLESGIPLLGLFPLDNSSRENGYMYKNVSVSIITAKIITQH